MHLERDPTRNVATAGVGVGDFRSCGRFAARQAGRWAALRNPNHSAERCLGGRIRPPTHGSAAAQSAVSAILFVVQLFAIFFLLRVAFGLSLGRTFAPLGAFIILCVVQTGLTTLVIRPLLTEAFVIPTRSMSPTIEPGDRFIVNKILQPAPVGSGCLLEHRRRSGDLLQAPGSASGLAVAIRPR